MPDKRIRSYLYVWTSYDYGPRYLKLIMCQLSGSTLSDPCRPTLQIAAIIKRGILSGQYPPDNPHPYRE